MPTKPLKPCAVSGCPNLCVGTYCEEHRKSRNRDYSKFNRNSDLQSFYKSKEWKELRKHHLAIEPLCVECKKQGKLTPATIVDHIVPIKFGGKALDPNNLQSLCSSCHSLKSNKEGSSGYGKKN